MMARCFNGLAAECGAWPYGMGRKVRRVISDGTPSLSAKPGHRPVPLLTYSVIPPTV